MNKLRMLLYMSVVLLLSSYLYAQDNKEILLWPNGAPGSEGKTGKEKIRIAETGDHVVTNILFPSVTGYLSKKENNTGAAVIIAPVAVIVNDGSIMKVITWQNGLVSKASMHMY